MRYSILYVAPFAAAAYAQSSESATVVPEISGSVTISSTYTYSNTETNFLTQTNSVGVVTGMPTPETLSGAGVTTQPALVTSQPTQPLLATIPAGLPTGLNTVYIGNGSSLSSFTVNVESSTTTVVGAAASGVSVTTGDAAAATASGTGSSASGASHSGSTHTSGTASGTQSATPSTSSSAAGATFQIASGSLLGLGAIFAGLL